MPQIRSYHWSLLSKSINPRVCEEADTWQLRQHQQPSAWPAININTAGVVSREISRMWNLKLWIWIQKLWWQCVPFLLLTACSNCTATSHSISNHYCGCINMTKPGHLMVWCLIDHQSVLFNCCDRGVVFASRSPDYWPVIMVMTVIPVPRMERVIAMMYRGPT